MGIPTTAQNVLLFFGLLQTSNHKRCQQSQLLLQKGVKPSASKSSEQQTGNSISDQKLTICEDDNQNQSDEEIDHRDLNFCLEILSAIFPDVQIEVFREMLLTFGEESRLAVITETLLKHRTKWVKGRYKSVKKEAQQCAQNTRKLLDYSGQVPIQEMFRSSSYKKAVKEVVIQEFKGLSRFTINLILDDFNYSYTHARLALLALSSKSWRFSLLALFKRRKPISSLDLRHHPLVVWQSNGQEFSIPTLKTSGCIELDQEIFELLINPLKQQAIAEQEEKDYKIALDMNTAEAVENDSLHDCECCFTAKSFEELSACDGGHFICFQCIKNSLKEAIYSNGWQKLINLKRGSLKCVAALMDECTSTIPIDLVRRALEKDRIGENLLRNLDERLAEDNILKSRLPLIRCPFCNYAEVDELYLPESKKSCKLKFLQSFSFTSLFILLLGVGMIPFLLVLLILRFLFLLPSDKNLGEYVVDQLNLSTNRIRLKYIGLKFSCKSKFCGRMSCRYCLKEWFDIHICYESSLQDLRTSVELAMSVAIKRTCPRCNTSFVKTSGCNKLTCVCGYQMCYICRKNIGNGEGYRHFCEHFRPNGGQSCSQCMKCDLYRCEDDEVVVKKAKTEAESKWMKKEGRLLGHDERFRKVLEEKWKQFGDTSLPEFRRWDWKMPKMEMILDIFVENLIFVR